MLCPACLKQTDDTFSFCPFCGKELKNDVPEELVSEVEEINNEEAITPPVLGDTEAVEQEEMPDIEEDVVSDISEGISEDNIEDKSHGKISPTLETIEPETHPLRRAFIIVTGAISIIMLIAAVALFCGVSDYTKEQVFNTVAEPAQRTESGYMQIPVENIYFPYDEIVMFEGQTKRLIYEAYPQNASINNITFAASGEGISFSADGRITAHVPGWKGSLTVTCDGVSAETNVRVLTEDEYFFDTIDWISHGGRKQEIYLKERVITPSPLSRENMLLSEPEARRKWGANLFGRVNDELASCKLSRKQLINKETGNPIDCDIYSDSSSGDIRKIVAIEYFEGFMKITDYYFLNGKLGFMFERNESSYRPGVANWGIEGTRLYFEGDALTTWRDVRLADERLQRDAAFVKTDYSYGPAGIEWDKTDYTYDYIANTVKNIKETAILPTIEEKELAAAEYALLEAHALNSAYNLYGKLTEMPETLDLSGCIVTTDAIPMKGVTVKAFSEGYDVLVSQTVTGDDGTYRLKVPGTGLPYTVSVYQDGYLTAHIQDAATDAGVLSLPPVCLVPDTSGDGSVLLTPIDTHTGGIATIYESDCEVNLRKGLNNRTDEPFLTITLPKYVEEDENAERTEEDKKEEDTQITAAKIASDGVENIVSGVWLPEEGAYELRVPPGNYTAELNVNGYEPAFFHISADGNERRVYTAIAGKVYGDEMKIVLEWDNVPLDLDSQLLLPSGERVTASGWKAETDSGPIYGVETITARYIEDGAFKYYVSDTTGVSREDYTSRQMSNSQVSVSIYTKNGLADKFYVPRGVSGVVWHVFNIFDGKVMPIERYYDNISDFIWLVK